MGRLERLFMQWLNIKTDHPPMLQAVLVATTSERSPIRMAWRCKRFEEDTVGAWHGGALGEQCGAILDHEITHWMPLPDPPVSA